MKPTNRKKPDLRKAPREAQLGTLAKAIKDLVSERDQADYAFSVVEKAEVLFSRKPTEENFVALAAAEKTLASIVRQHENLCMVEDAARRALGLRS